MQTVLIKAYTCTYPHFLTATCTTVRPDLLYLQ